MVELKKILDKLNEEQIKPVLDTEGAVLVVAGAGSGKTRVLTSRIAYLVMEKGVNPAEILAITFTNKASGEMRERLNKIVGDVSEMWVSTIHSMCVKILRRDIDKIGYEKNFTIYDETDKDRVLKRVLEDNNIDADKLFKTIKNCISNAKNDCLSPEEYRENNLGLRCIDEVYTAYSEYEKVLGRSNALDFDDLLYKTYQLFKVSPETAEYYARKFKYIHIDEFQDTNAVQFAIAKVLASVHGNIFVVGDDDQSIYGWRGAKVENILRFDEYFYGAKVYKLEQNYRSTKKILSLANCIIKNNKGRRGKELWTNNPDGVKVETFEASDENQEASYVAMQIKSLIERTDLAYKDFAVFMRINSLSRAFEQEFIKYGIPYRVYGGFRFFERKEIKDILSYLKIIDNHADDESFLRAISTPKRGIGEKTLMELKEFCVGKGLSLYDGLNFIDEADIGASAKNKLATFKALLDKFVEFSRDNTSDKIIDFVLEATSFNEQFSEKTEENVSKLMNIGELKNTAVQFHKDNRETTLRDYLSSVTLSTDTDDIKSDDTVTVATIHASKGLEFKCVFVAGLDEKILPVSRCMDDEDELEEERRLMYVAVTRAKERLYITRATSRYMYGSREFMVPSRFYKEAKRAISPDEAVDYGYRRESYIKREKDYGNEMPSYIKTEDNNGGYSSSYAKTLLNNDRPKEVNNGSYSNYKTGTKVRHAKFGEGVVIAVNENGENTSVDVAFKGVGIKKLILKYAPLEIV
ncbi:MAG: UvrD-helicase domain-containing protein [Clostridia bacterium]|nr:UvrD-helicase domain-containing protein [Clostridia bacterium]